MLNEFHSSDGLQLIFFSQRIIFDGTSDPMGAYTSCIRSFFKSTVRNYTHFQWNNENSEAEKGMKSVEIHSVHSTLAYIKCRAKPSHSVCVDIDNRHRKQCLPNTQSNTMFVARVKNKKRHKKQVRIHSKCFYHFRNTNIVNMNSKARAPVFFS